MHFISIFIVINQILTLYDNNQKIKKKETELKIQLYNYTFFLEKKSFYLNSRARERERKRVLELYNKQPNYLFLKVEQKRKQQNIFEA